MGHTAVRSGTFAVVGGQEFSAGPTARFDGNTVRLCSAGPDAPDCSSPVEFAWDGPAGEWQAWAPIAELDRLYRVSAHATYRGRTVRVLGIRDGAADLYVDSDGAWALANGFTQTEKYVCQKTVDAGNLAGLYELQTDVLLPIERVDREQARRALTTRIGAMMRREPSRIFAMIGGREYRALAPPSGGTITVLDGDAADGVPRATVATAQCDRIDDVSPRARYWSYECHVVGIDEVGTVELLIAGPAGSYASDHGFTAVEPGVWMRTIDVLELRSYHERHTDLLFAATPPGAGR